MIQFFVQYRKRPASLASPAKDLGSKAHAATIEGASSFGKVVLVAIPFGMYQTLPGKPLEGKVIVDAMNYYPQRDGRIEFDDLTSTELVAQHLRGVRLVKAFNTMYYETLATQGQPGAPSEDRLALFVAGDDVEAKGAVSRLIQEIGFTPIDTGSLHDGGQAGAGLTAFQSANDCPGGANRSEQLELGGKLGERNQGTTGIPWRSWFLMVLSSLCSV